MVQIADALNMLVIAEGIEHPHQAEWLRELDCPLGQGYHYAKPLEPAAAENYLRIAAQRDWRQTHVRSVRRPIAVQTRSAARG
jgi:EAL domain-containing protein (putative c-di-GMP-specific phosphodiesterase class I)